MAQRFLFINPPSYPSAINCAHFKTVMDSSQHSQPNESDSFPWLTELLPISPQSRRTASYQRIVVPGTPCPRKDRRRSGNVTTLDRKDHAGPATAQKRSASELIWSCWPWTTVEGLCTLGGKKEQEKSRANIVKDNGSVVPAQKLNWIANQTESNSNSRTDIDHSSAPNIRYKLCFNIDTKQVMEFFSMLVPQRTFEANNRFLSLFTRFIYHAIETRDSRNGFRKLSVIFGKVIFTIGKTKNVSYKFYYLKKNTTWTFIEAQRYTDYINRRVCGQLLIRKALYELSRWRKNKA